MTLSYVVRARDEASVAFSKIAASADRLNEDLNKLDGKTATPKLKLEDKQLKVGLDSIELRMARLDKRVTTTHMNDEQIAAARHQADRLQLAMDKLNAQRTKIHVDSSALTKLGKASFLQPSLIGTAVALSPALIPLAAQVAAGVGAIGISFGAAGTAAGIFGVMAGTVLAKASQDAQKLAALNVKLATASTAAQKKAVKQQIDALTAGWAKGYMDLIGNYQDFQAKWKSVSQAITVPALNAWLPALSKGLQFLKPLLTPVADLFKSWGQSLNTYFSNPITAIRIKNIAAAIGSFAAIQLGEIAKFIGDIAKGFFNLGKDLVGSGANLGAAGTSLMHIGDAFLAWSKSAKARADVNGFLHFLHQEGPVVTGILRDLGKLLPGIFAGATTVGTLELKALGDFLNLIAKLPSGWQKGLTEAAGALLLMSKLGIIKVGLKIVGLGAKLLSGGTIALGGTTAAAEMKAAIVSGGAQAATEIRAAMAGGGAAGAAGAEGAAAGAAAGSGSRFKLLGTGWGALLAAGLVAGVTTKLPVIHRSIWSLGDPPGPGQKANFLNSWSAFGQGLARSFSDSFVKPSETAFHAVSASFTVFRHTMSASFDAFRHTMSASFDAFRHTMSASFAALRHDIAAAWDAIWRNTKNAVTTGISAVVGFFRGLPGKAIHALSGLGTDLYNFAHQALVKFGNGAKAVWSSITKWFSGLPSKILHALGIKSPPDWAISAGRHVMQGILKGLHLGTGGITGFISGLTGRIGALFGGGHAGPGGGAPAANAALARRLMPAWGSGAEWAAWNALAMQESGWSNIARNQSSGAYGIAQALPPTKYPFAGQAAGGSNPTAQITWMIGYIRSRYGDPIGAYAHERAFNWYGRGLRGGIFTRPTLIGVGEAGPERVDVTPGTGSAGNGGASMAETNALLRETNALQRRVCALLEGLPARSGVAFGRELNGAARRVALGR